MHRNIDRLKHQNFDILVCGGGIYGAWTAYDAALRGLRVALVDKGDWASGTSSASSKLIHGGLRYLETFDFKLVKKSLAERERLLKTAPHRVWPLRFGIPVYQANRIGAVKLKIGLWLYDVLAGKPADNRRHRQHSATDFLGSFPALSAHRLVSGFSYFDAQTDDARFVLEIIDGACSAGAVCINYCEITELRQRNSTIDGAVLTDLSTGQTLDIAAKIVVDTSGRWSDQMRKADTPSRLSKGIHLVMPKILNDQALLLTAHSDGRVFFMIPWYGRTLLGTTDTNYRGDIDRLPIAPEDIDYLLTEANGFLAGIQWTEADVIGKFAGVRVLQSSELDNPSHISRDWTLQTSPNGFLSSIGGKFTSAREDAAEIVDHVCRRLSLDPQCQTREKPFPWSSDIDYLSFKSNLRDDALSLGIDDESFVCTLNRHGSRTPQIFQLCRENPGLIHRIKPDLPFIYADLVFCARAEMIVHLDDLIRRRLPLVILAELNADDLRQIAEFAARELNWDNAKIALEIERCRDSFS